jgi:hypothetical protein
MRKSTVPVYQVPFFSRFFDFSFDLASDSAGPSGLANRDDPARAGLFKFNKQDSTTTMPRYTLRSVTIADGLGRRSRNSERRDGMSDTCPGKYSR